MVLCLNCKVTFLSSFLEENQNVSKFRFLGKEKQWRLGNNFLGDFIRKWTEDGNPIGVWCE